MTSVVRWCLAAWALSALVVLAFVDISLVRWLIVVPVLVGGPGLVAARFVSPDDGRFRPAVALVAGLAVVVLVSEIFALGGWFSVDSVAAVIAALVVIGAVAVPAGNGSVTVLPPRRPIDPRSPVAIRLRGMSPSRVPVSLGSTPPDVPAHMMPDTWITSPTLVGSVDRHR